MEQNKNILTPKSLFNLTLIVIAIIVSVFFVFYSERTEEAEAALGWLTGYDFRKEITINGIQTDAFHMIDPVQINLDIEDAWTEFDVSPYVPVGATGVLFHVESTNDSFPCYLEFRKKGSTDSLHEIAVAFTAWKWNTHAWTSIGIDNNMKFEYWYNDNSDRGSKNVYLVGYTGNNVIFLDNAVDLHLDTAVGVPTGWIDIATSSIYCSASTTGLIFKMVSWCNSSTIGVRKKGSNDDRHQSNFYSASRGSMIGCDANQIFQEQIQDPDSDLWLIGCVEGGATFNIDAIDITPTNRVTWEEITLPTGSSMGMIEVYSSGFLMSDYDYALRKNGSTEDIYRKAAYHPWAFVEADSDYKIEGKLSSASSSFFLTGYDTGGVLTDYPMNIIIHKDLGTDGSPNDNDVYLNNACQDDFDDVRFTKSDGITELDFWRESYTSGATSSFWVNFDFLATSTSDFYIYYGNSSTSTTSNGNNTFSFFDDFDAGTSYATTGAGNGSYSESGGILTITENATGTGVDFGVAVDSSFSFTDDRRQMIMASVRAPVSKELHGFYFDATNADDSDKFLKWEGTDVWGIDMDQSYSGSNFQTVYDILNHADFNNNAPLILANDDDTDAVAESEYDWVLVRNYHDPEPSFGTFGSEENLLGVSTVEATNITTNSVYVRGNVTSIGNENPTRYIDYSTSSGEPYSSFVNCETGGIGTYECGLSSLNSQTTYYYRARIVDSFGRTATGTEMSFITAPTGGGSPPTWPNPPTPPPEGFSILINDGATYTNTREVELKLVAGSDTVNMAISEREDFSGASQELYAITKDWTLSEGNGEKTVYAKFYTFSGQSSSIVSDSIILNTRVCAGADLNFDTLVDLFDFGILVYFWDDTNPANTCADINIDGIVDLVDFGTMIYEWPELQAENYYDYLNDYQSDY